MADSVIFSTGRIGNLPLDIINGKVYFATEDNKDFGAIFFDINDKRYQMSQMAPSNTSNSLVAYGRCLSPATEANKVIELLPNSNGWQCTEGSIVYVLFSNTNTAEAPTLSIKTATAQENEYVVRDRIIYFQGKPIDYVDLQAGGDSKNVIGYMYNGQDFICISGVSKTENQPLIIGDQTYDGSQKVVVPVYDGLVEIV